MHYFDALTLADQQTVVQVVAMAMEFVRIHLDDEDQDGECAVGYSDAEVARMVRAQSMFNLGEMNAQGVDPAPRAGLLHHAVNEYINSLKM